VAEGEISASQAPLYPEEERAVRTAIMKRQREFRAGRMLARRAMERIGISPGSLPANADRTPAWPSGVVGSITHSQCYCAAVVAHASEVTSVGIDIEETDRFDPGLLRLICVQDELLKLEQFDAAKRRLLGTLLFSAKESFFKCQFPLTRAWVGFMDAEVCFEDAAEGEFTVTLHKHATGDRLFPRAIGRFRTWNGTVATAFAIPAGKSSDGTL
jgi:4'-phosphopantetheinyl transferase EntD